jgi:hypothetical protein
MTAFPVFEILEANGYALFPGDVAGEEKLQVEFEPGLEKRRS